LQQLSGSAQPHAKGHLLAVIGYDSLNQKVISMDPAFPADGETHVFYAFRILSRHGLEGEM